MARGPTLVLLVDAHTRVKTVPGFRSDEILLPVIRNGVVLRIVVVRGHAPGDHAQLLPTRADHWHHLRKGDEILPADDQAVALMHLAAIASTLGLQDAVDPEANEQLLHIAQQSLARRVILSRSVACDVYRAIAVEVGGEEVDEIVIVGLKDDRRDALVA